MPPSALTDGDITLNRNPLYLRDKAPSIHGDYISKEETHAEYSISPEISRLMANPLFTRAVQDKLGAFVTVELQIEPNREVFARLPGSERYEKIEMAPHATIDSDLSHIIRKTEAAYKRYQDSLPPTPVSSPVLQPRRVQSHPEIPPQEYDALRSQLSELQQELRTLKLQRELDQKRHQVQELQRKVRELEGRAGSAEKILSEAQDLFEEEEAPDLVRAIQGLQQRVKEQGMTNTELSRALDSLRLEKQAEVHALQDQLDEANGLFDPLDTRPLPAKIRSLMEEAQALRPLKEDVARLKQIIAEIQEIVPVAEDRELPEAITRLQKAQEKLQERLAHSQAEVLSLWDEVHQLREQHSGDEERLRGAINLASDWQKQNQALEEELQGARASIHKLKRELSDTQEALKRDRHSLQLAERQLDAIAFHVPQDASGRSLPQRVGDLVFELQDAREENTALKMHFKELLARAEDELEGLRPLTREVEQLKETLRAIQESLCSGENLPEQVAKLKRAYEELLGVHGDTLEANRKLQETFLEKTSSLKASEERVRALTQELHKAQQENSALVKILEGIQEGLEVHVDPERLPTAAKDLLVRYKALQIEQGERGEELQRVRKEAASLAQTLKEQMEANARLSSQHEQDGLTIERMGRELKDLERVLGAENQGLKERLEALQKEQAALAELIPNRQDGSLRERMESFKREFDLLKLALVSQQQTIEGLERDLIAAAQENAHLVKASSGLQGQLTLAQQELERIALHLPASERSLSERVRDLALALEKAREENVALKKHFEGLMEEAQHELEGLRPLTREVKQLKETLRAIQESLGSGENLPEQVAKLKRAYDQLFDGHGETLEANRAFQEALLEKTSTLEASEERVRALTKELHEAQQANEHLTAQHNQDGLTIERMGRELEDLQRVLGTENQDLKERLEALQKEQAALAELIPNRQDGSLRERMESFKREFDLLKLALLNQQQTIEGLERDLIAAAQENAHLVKAAEETRSALQRELTLAETELDALRLLPQEVATLKKSLQTLRDALALGEEEDLLMQVETLKRSFAKLAGENPQLQSANAHLQEELSKATAAFEKLQEAEETIVHLKEALEQARKAGQEERLEALRLKGICREIAEEIAYSPALDEELGEVPEYTHLSEEVRRRLRSIEEAEDQLALKQDAIEKLQRKMHSMEEGHANQLAAVQVSARAELEERLQREKGQLEKELEHARSQFEARRDDLREVLAKVRQDLEEMRISRDAYSEENTALTQQNEKLEKIIKRKDQEAREAEAVLKSKDASLAEEQEVANRLRSELSDLKKAQAALRIELEKIGEERGYYAELSSKYERRYEKYREKNSALQAQIQRLEEDLGAAESRIAKLEGENKALRELLGRLLGIEFSYAPTLEDLHYAAERFEKRHGSIEHLIQERDRAREELQRVAETALKTQEALDDVSGQAEREREAALLREQQLREETERMHLEMLRRLEELAVVAQQDNAIEEVVVVEAEDPQQAQVLHAEQGLQAMLQAMGHGATLPDLSSLQRDVLRINQRALSGQDEANITSIHKKLLLKYNKPDSAMPAAGLLAILDVEGKKIREFCVGMQAILNEKIQEDETDLDIVGQTQLQALQNLQYALRQANAQILELNRRRLAGEALNGEDLAQIETLAQTIPVLKEEMTRIAERFVPKLLNALVSKEVRSFPYIIRELEGWGRFFDDLDARKYKDPQGRVAVAVSKGVDYRLERFRQAAHSLEGTLTRFFQLFPSQ
ncbi:MAG: hypothetical protein AB7N99_06760 [Simkaniaceae bacterium]